MASEPDNQSSSHKWFGFPSLALLCALVVLAFWFWLRPERQSNVESSAKALFHTIARSDLQVSVIEQGTLESSENVEIKCKVRGDNTVIWVIENGTIVKEGDVLCRLDTLAIEDTINERSKYAHWSRSGAESASANARRAKLAIKQYLEGTYVVSLKTMEKDLAIAQANLKTAQNMLDHSQSMFERGYVSSLEVEEKEFQVEQAKLNVGVQQTEIEVLRTFTKEEELKRLKGELKAAEANRDSLVERAKMDGTRRDLAEAELKHCVIHAPKSGMVVYPSAQAWEKTPDVEEGATVHRDQTLLLMPDLENMQVKVGIHESVVDRLNVGLKAKVTLPELKLEAAVSEIASVAQPAGWWTGNVVKYDTWIELPQAPNLRPGMSAEVEIILAEYSNVVTIPVAAVIETETESLCWVQTKAGPERRILKLGDSNDVYLVVDSGVQEGEQVILNPRSFVEEAKNEVLKTIDETTEQDSLPEGNADEAEANLEHTKTSVPAQKGLKAKPPKKPSKNKPASKGGVAE